MAGRVRDWLIRHAPMLTAASAIATALAAVIALIVVPWQISQNDRIQRDQTAREIYREFLNLTMQKPELATADYCALENLQQRAAYSAYVDYLLYTAEQMIDTADNWRAPMASYLGDHKAYVCSANLGKDMQGLVRELGISCAAADRCE